MTTILLGQNHGQSSNASSSFAGDGSQVWFRIRTDLRIEMLRGLYAETGEFAFMAWPRIDIAPAQMAAFAALTGIVLPTHVG